MAISIRPYGPSDTASVVDILARCLTGEWITSAEFQRKVLLDANFDQKGALVACAGSRVVGFALGIVRRYRIEDAPPDFERSWITLIAIDEEFRRQGIGTRLVVGLESYFRYESCASIWVSPYAPNYFTPGIDVNAYPGALAFFEALGYQEVYRPLAMEADLGELSVPDWLAENEAKLPSSVTIESFRPELILPLLDWMRVEFPGDWQRLAREAMTKIIVGELQSDNLWIAHECGRVIGYCQHGSDGRFGPFGVSRSERGRGIGAVLLFKCLEAMRAKGLSRAWFLWTDDIAARLYAEFGFRESRRFAVMRKGIER